MNNVNYQGQITLLQPGPATKLSTAPLPVRLKKAWVILWGLSLLCAILIGISYAGGWNWLFWTGVGIGILGLLGGILSGINAKVAPCPYCGSPVGLDEDNDLAMNNEQEAVECQKCHEWLISDHGELTAMDETTFGIKRDKTRAPVFIDGFWPEECLTCGAPTTRYEQLTKNSIDGTALLVGTISTRSAKVSNVPYCQQHGDQVSLGFKDDKPKLKFQDFGPMRRYVHVNFGKKPLVAKK